MVPGNTDSIQTYEVTPHDFAPIRLGSSAIAGIKPSITGITGINTGITGVSKTYPLKGPVRLPLGGRSQRGVFR